MDFDLFKHTILLTVAGSRAYGIHTSDSDVDLKGVVIPPKEYILGLKEFEQSDSSKELEIFKSLLSDSLKSVVSKTKLEGTLYELRKFIRLAIDCNPNILDALFCRDDEILFQTETGKLLRENRDLFISAKAKHTFSGYAIAQLKRIKSHKEWLMHAPDHEPTRKEFGLRLEVISEYDYNILWDAISKKMDSWSWDFSGVSKSDILKIEENIATHLTEIGYSVSDKWIYAARFLGAQDIIPLIQKEKSFQDAKNNWKKYCDWKKNRNASRSQLESQYGYDCKHAAHLVRLLRMGHEILTTGEVHVWRGDIDSKELLEIRNGAWPYEYLISWADEKDSELTEIYKSKKYVIPHTPYFERVSELCIQLLERGSNV